MKLLTLYISLARDSLGCVGKGIATEGPVIDGLYQNRNLIAYSLGCKTIVAQVRESSSDHAVQLSIILPIPNLTDIETYNRLELLLS